MSGRNRRQFLAAKRVACQHRCGEMERIEDRNNVLAQSLRAEARFRMTGRSVPSPCYAVNVTKTGQFGREVVKDVGGISRTGQQHKRRSRTSPIEDFDLNGIFHRNELHRSEEHTSELPSPCNLVFRPLLEKKIIIRAGYVATSICRCAMRLLFSSCIC